jgi:serine/threonine protein kinase/Tfp pilus assembly protein PilF
MERIKDGPCEADEILLDALSLPYAERWAFLDEVRGENPMLRQQVEARLRPSLGLDAVFESGGVCSGPLWESFSADLIAEPSAVMPDRIGPYRVISEIGRGGMGVVYLAVRSDGQVEQKVAVKVLTLDRGGAEAMQRFAQERQIVASLSHPAIAGLVDAGISDDGRPYFAMEYVDGEAITEYCDRLQLTIEERLRLFNTAARAVDYAHRNLVVHRDLKPSNILVTNDGRVKLLDFGIAKVLDHSALPHVAPTTRTGLRPMTPEYASPEQVRGAPVATASDVYQLGVLLYELMAGTRPHVAESRSTFDIERMILEDDAAPPSARIGRNPASTDCLVSSARRVSPERLRRRLRGDLDTIVLKALHKQPERRYLSAQQMAEDVDRHLAGRALAARKDAFFYRTRKFIRRNRLVVSVAGAAGVVIAGLIGIHTVRLANERDRARQFAETAQSALACMEDLFRGLDPYQSPQRELTAQELLDRGTMRIENELADSPELQAQLLRTLGNTYHNLGLYDRATALLEKAVETARTAYGEGHGFTALCQTNLALEYDTAGRVGEAEALYRRAIDVMERCEDPTRGALATALNNFASLLSKTNRLDEAETVYRRALDLATQELGPDHLDTARTVFNLGNVYLVRAELEKAQSHYERALAVRERALDSTNPLIAEVLFNLAQVYDQHGDPVAATRMLQRALDIWTTSLGHEHPVVARAFNNLTGLRARAGHCQEALDYCEKALAMRKAVFGADHAQVAMSLQTLGWLRAGMGQYNEARSLLEEALATGLRTVGPTDSLIARILSNLGDISLEQGDLDTSEKHYARALAIAEHALGEKHPVLSEILVPLATVKARRNDSSSAEKLLLRALSVCQEAYGQHHPSRAAALLELAGLQIDQNRLDEARHTLAEAASIYPTGVDTANRCDFEAQSRKAEVASLHARLLDSSGDRENAQAQWRRAVAILAETDLDARLTSVEHLRAVALLSLGRIDEARPVVRWLGERGWEHPGLAKLCAKWGL